MALATPWVRLAGLLTLAAAAAATDAQARGALLVGNPEEVAAKIMRHSVALGGITRVTFQMDVASLSHEQLMQSIELIGTRLSPLLNKPLT